MRSRRILAAGIVAALLYVNPFFSLLISCCATLYAQDADSPDSNRASTPAVSYNPVADPGATIVFRHARFTVLTPQLIRMEWAADGKFEDRPSLVFLNRRLPVPTYSMRKHGKRLSIDTGALQLTYDNSGPDGGKFTADNLSVRLTVDGKPVTWSPGMENSANLLGTTRTLDGALGDKTKEPIGEGLLSRDGWVLVDDSTRPLFDSDDFRFAQGEQSPWPWVMQRTAGDRLDWYFFGYGHDYKKTLNDFVRVAGRIPLPPRFAFGTWWSRYWAYSDQELDHLIQGFHDNTVPLDVLVIDMDWHLNNTQLEAMHETDQSRHSLGWSGYTWNPLVFPDPKAFLSHVHQEGLKVTLNLHPASGVQPWEAAYPAMARAMDIDPATKKYVPFDITNKKFATNYMDLLHHPLEREGIDFWWLDWQQEPNTSTPGVNPTWWLNYVHFTDQEREGKRPLLFHRWGGLGNHRYEIGFSGDTVSVWPSLAFQPWFTATAANVGYAYWSHDIGGHMPGAVDPELFTRWVEFGAFSPILRTHTTKNPESERRIWAYPEPYSSIMRATFRERYALQPYLYTEGRATYDTGVAFLHPLYYDWPQANAAYDNKGEYVFGSKMIVAPVVAPVDSTTELAKQSVWIPKGEWIEQPTGRHFTGPVEVTRQFSVDQIPVYLPAGAIVPRQPPMEYTDEKPVDPLIVRIYPLSDGHSSSYRLYADDSQSESYQNGVCTWTPLTAEQKGDTLTVDVTPVEGSYPGAIADRAYEIQLPDDWPPASVTVNGTQLSFTGRTENRPGWHYEGNLLTTVVTTPRFSVHTPVRIEIRRATGSLASRSKLDGIPGSIARLHSAYDALNALWSAAWSPNVLIETWQTGDRLSYRPETAQQEIARFPRLYEQSISAVQKLADRLSAQTADQAGTKQDPNRNRVLLERAAAMLQDGKPQEEMPR
ncbi:MAG TPA: TIM-barrel domain-containing protein [Acidobacteriaceae bacterium]|jgi:alpha-glucosidase|nr:TIM-barrel domain-containing protein [Acidobacteriaceae bacterium]